MSDQTKSFYRRHERHLSTLVFLVGFALDNILLKRVDHWISNVAFSGYLFGAGLAIILWNAHEAGRLKGPRLDRIAAIFPPLIQFLFGGLMSGYIVFYSRSASLIENWPFILFLVLLVVGNEIFRKKYSRLTFQLVIFFITSFSYFIFSVPIIMGKIGTGIFVISGGVSLLSVVGVALIIRRVAPAQFHQSKNGIFWSVLGLYLIFNFSYFTDIIPPIPLALKEIGVYHSVEKIGEGSYIVSFEPSPWYLFKETSDTFNLTPGQPVLVLSSVFAPAEFATKIIHRWLNFDDNNGKWITTDLLEFPILGGRDGGYRGYSKKDNIAPGKWRVEVETKRGQLIGQITFNVVYASALPTIETNIK